MLVRDVMRTDVKTIEPDANIQEAAEKMTRFRIGSLIVTEGTRLVGIITERDILMKIVAKAKDPAKTKVSDIMTKEVIMISPDKDLEEAALVMVEKKIKKLPVLLYDKLIGIITATDICAAQPKLMEEISQILIIPGRRKIVGG